MNGEFSIPPLRDLPPGRLAQRKEHLLFEITHERESRGANLRPHRRRLVALAAAALIVVVGTASAFAIHALFVEGIVGLAPVGAVPSSPERGERVLGFAFGHSMGDPGRFTLTMYADGRLIWQRVGDYSRTDEYRNSTGLLERRLTPEGVELVKAEVISTGLVDHDLHLHSGHGLYFGQIDLRNGDRRVHVTWGDVTWGDVSSGGVDRQVPTPEQASALTRLDARLEDPVSWLPASAWQDPEIKPYVPSGYSVCYEGARGVGLSRVLALLPPSAENFLRTQDRKQEEYTNLLGSFVYWCSDLTNKEARALARILDDAGLKRYEDVFGLTYGVHEREIVAASEFSLRFEPLSPHDREGVRR
jgi:hypothetical protein